MLIAITLFFITVYTGTIWLFGSNPGKIISQWLNNQAESSYLEWTNQ
jgi:hypothetical protein